MAAVKKMELDLKKGTLTATVLRKYGEDGFVKQRKKGRKPKIKINVLKELKESPNALTRKRATFALSARGWETGKKGGK